MFTARAATNRTVIAEMPDSADIADTVGYIYYKKDMPGFAIPVLTQCLTKDPKNVFIEIEGHTDSQPFAASARGYSNWELSADRANAARRWMHANGMRDDQVTQVRGFADQSLRNPKDPRD